MGSYNQSRRRDRYDEDFSRDRRLTHGLMSDECSFDRIQPANFHSEDKSYHLSYRKRRCLDDKQANFLCEPRYTSSRNHVPYQTDLNHQKNSKNLHYGELRELDVVDSGGHDFIKDASFGMTLHSTRHYNIEGHWKTSPYQKVVNGQLDHTYGTDRDHSSGVDYKLNDHRRASNNAYLKDKKGESTTCDRFVITEQTCDVADEKNSKSPTANDSLPVNFMCQSSIFGCESSPKSLNKIGNMNACWRKSTTTPFLRSSAVGDMSQTKKPRLGWGEGLAKYESNGVNGNANTSDKGDPMQFVSHIVDHLVNPHISNHETKSWSAVCDKIEAKGRNPDEYICSPGEGSCDNTSYDKFSTEFPSCIKNCSHSSMAENAHMVYLSYVPNRECSPHFEYLDGRSDILVKSMANEVLQMSYQIDTLLMIKSELLHKLEGVEMELDTVEKELENLNQHNNSKCCHLKGENFNLSIDPKILDQSLFTKSLLGSKNGIDNRVTCITADEQSDIQAGPVTSNNVIPNLKQRPLSTLRGLVLGTKSKGSSSSSAGATFELDRKTMDQSNNFPRFSICDGYLFPYEGSDILLWNQAISMHETKRKKMEMKVFKDTKRLKFKEQILSLKYRILQKWLKEQNLMMKCWRKCSGNDDSIRKINGTLSNFMTTLQDTSDLVACTKSGFLAGVPTLDVHVSCYRDFLKMPALLLDDKNRQFCRFMTKNGLVEDPVAAEEERKLMNAWTQEEKNIFWEKFAIFRKNFREIATFLKHKTVADCVEYYYKHHKSECPKEFKQKNDLKGQRYCLHKQNYLCISRNTRNHLSYETPLDVLGTIAALTMGDVYENIRLQVLPEWHRDMHTVSKFIAAEGMDKGLTYNFRGKRNIWLKKELTRAVDIPNGCQKHTVVRGSCQNGVVNVPKMSYRKSGISGCTIDNGPYKPLISKEKFEVLNFSKECYVDPNKDWTDNEKSLFVDAVSRHGKDFRRISAHVHSRTEAECRLFFCKARKPLKLDELVSQDENIVKAGNHHFDATSVQLHPVDAPVANVPFRGKTEDASNLQEGDSTEAKAGAAKIEEVDTLSPSSLERRGCNFTQDEQSELEELWEKCKRNLGADSTSERSGEKPSACRPPYWNLLS